MQTEKKVFNNKEAMDMLHVLGTPVRLPEWIGFWFKDTDGKIKVFNRIGDILDTPNYDNYSMRNDWEIVTEGLGYEFASLAAKAGKLVRRSGWNGSGQFVFIRPADSLEVEMITEKVKSLPKSLKDYFRKGVERLFANRKYAEEIEQNNIDTSKFGDRVYNPNTDYTFEPTDKIEFTAYFCLKNAQGKIVNGWIPSTGDLLATDWEIAD